MLRLLASGSRVTAIAETLSVGRETVRTHLRQIYRKLGVNDGPPRWRSPGARAWGPDGPVPRTTAGYGPDMPDELRYEVADGVATFTINRPERHNALTW